MSSIFRRFNKIVESNIEPSNTNDIWLNKGRFCIYYKGEWCPITITAKDANTVAEYVENNIEFIINEIEKRTTNKQDTIEDLEVIREGAAKGATALQEHQDISHLASKEELQNLQNEVIANEEVVAAAFNDVNDRINAISENVSGTTVTKEELESTVETINQTISDNKSATDTAIEGLETSIGNVDAKFANYATTESLTTEITNLTNEIIANEEVVAAALNDLNERLNNGGGSSGGSGVVTFYAAENFTDEIKAKNKAAYETYITAGGTKGVVFNLVDSGINLFPVNSYMEGDILLLEFITTLFSDSNTIESLLLPCHPDGTVEA